VTAITSAARHQPLTWLRSGPRFKSRTRCPGLTAANPKVGAPTKEESPSQYANAYLARAPPTDRGTSKGSRSVGPLCAPSKNCRRWGISPQHGRCWRTAYNRTPPSVPEAPQYLSRHSHKMCGTRLLRWIVVTRRDSTAMLCLRLFRRRPPGAGAPLGRPDTLL